MAARGLREESGSDGARGGSPPSMDEMDMLLPGLCMADREGKSRPEGKDEVGEGAGAARLDGGGGGGGGA